MDHDFVYRRTAPQSWIPEFPAPRRQHKLKSIAVGWFTLQQRKILFNVTWTMEFF
jgi:hypothetical protein